jgi:hypothetical protein
LPAACKMSWHAAVARRIRGRMPSWLALLLLTAWGLGGRVAVATVVSVHSSPGGRRADGDGFPDGAGWVASTDQRGPTQPRTAAELASVLARQSPPRLMRMNLALRVNLALRALHRRLGCMGGVHGRPSGRSGDRRAGWRCVRRRLAAFTWLPNTCGGAPRRRSHLALEQGRCGSYSAKFGPQVVRIRTAACS